ncbi:MAG TPA: protein kinase [Ignavibacteriaceae bacterium]|nr:protein kinase [Ignavibacteriaceae bacterium]
MIGETILHYKITEKLGEGGMGKVYKARDTKLERFVALKFLPSQMTATEEDKARFIQEAKAASAMNHPNVCTIYSIEEYNGQLFIVMEFVEGKTLKDKKDNLSEKQIIEIGIQIAEGLAAAHEKGIVHRDIKPENIMIRKDGIAQIMDFGLAKLRETSGVSRLTKAGTTMGTMGYMSPEQVQGLDVDHRTDIFSLGVVLYEVLAGESPFKGVHETAIMYEIVNVDPTPISTIKEGIEPELDNIILECLEKDKDERCQSAKELAKDLRKVKKSTGQKKSRIYSVNTKSFKEQTTGGEISKSSGSIAIEAFNKRFELRKLLPLIFLIALISSILFAYLYFSNSGVKNSSILQFEIQSPPGTNFTGDSPKISPDGKSIVFIAKDSTGKSMIWLRPLASIKANTLEGTENATLPFWSYDGKYLGFFQNHKLRKIDLSTGSIQTICDAADGQGAIWNKDNTILFLPVFISPLYKVNSGGGIPEKLNLLDNSYGEENQIPSQFLPDNIHYLYTSSSRNQGQDNIIIGSLKDNSKHRLFDKGQSLGFYSNPQLIARNILFYLNDNKLIMQKINLSTYKLEGEKRTILNNINQFDVSENLVIAVSGSFTNQSNFLLYDRKGNVLNQINNLGLVVEIYPSPDEKNIVYHRVMGPGMDKIMNQDIWIYNRERDFSTRFTTDPAADIAPVWSSDSKKIVYSSSPDSVYNIYEKDIDGEREPKLLFKNNFFKAPLDWSSDGKYILAAVDALSTGYDLWIIPMFSDKKPFPYLHTKFNEGLGCFSPDGKWIAYVSDETGSPEVYIQSFPEPGKRYVVSTKGGSYPKWRKDGKELFYISSNDSLTAVEIKLKDHPEIGGTKSLFKIRNITYPNMYTVLNDGQKFLINSFNTHSTFNSIQVIANWKSLIAEK